MATKSTRWATSNVIESWKVVELTSPTFNILKHKLLKSISILAFGKSIGEPIKVRVLKC